MKLFFPACRFFQFFRGVISPNWHTTAWTADISPSCWLVGVALCFRYIYTHMWVWLGWYFVWSSWKWAMTNAHITGFFFFFLNLGWWIHLPKELISFCLEGKCSFLSAVRNPSTWFAGFGKLLFWPSVCLAITIPLSKKVNKRRKKKLALACLTYETRRSRLPGWGWVPYLSMPVIFIISTYIKKYILFRW